MPVEILGLAGLLQPARGRRGARVRARRAATRRPAWRSRGSCSARGTASGYKDLALRRGARQARRATRCDWSTEDEGEATPFLFAEALEHLDEVEGLSDEGRARLRGVPRRAARSSASRRAARSASSSARSIRRTGHPRELDAHADRGRGAAARSATSPRSSTRSTRSSRSRASSRSARSSTTWTRSSAGQAGVGAGAAVRRGLREGHDDPRREGARVRPRLRARARARPAAQPPRSSRTRRSGASRSTSSSAATPRSSRRSTAC